MRAFPIQGGWSRKRHQAIPHRHIPWDMISPHEPQALKNHAGQDLVELARRGGLGYCEAVAVMQDRDWHRMDEDKAVEQLNSMVEKFLSKPSEGVKL